LTIVFNSLKEGARGLVRPNARLKVHGGVALVFAVAALSPGCGSSDSGGGTVDAGESCQFATAADFANFTQWQHYLVTSSFIANNVHTNGPRDVYINKCPPPGAKEFPVGTIVIKVIPQPKQALKAVFAQVKVGCGYNQDGAAGWEWFDLLTSLNGGAPGSMPQIVWQGQTPPASQSYGGDPQECNDCHSTMGEGNDSIITPALDLKTIQCKEPSP
jgi:hypothetical protein